MIQVLVFLAFVSKISAHSCNFTWNGRFKAKEVIGGPLYQLGDYRECMFTLQQQYCLAEVQLGPSNGSSQLWQYIQESNSIRTHFRRDKLLLGVCTPLHCSHSQVAHLTEDSLRDAALELGVTIAVTVNEKDCQHNGDSQLTAAEWFIAFMILFIILLVLSGSVYDGVRRIRKKRYYVHSIKGRLLMSFSLLTNWERLSTLSDSLDSRSLRCIQGMRSLSMFIIILAHTIFWTIRGPIQNPEWVEKSYGDIFRASFLNGNAIMGTFLSISGFLLGYMFIRDVNARGSFSFFDFLNAIGHRYIRLTPVYAVTLALASSWFNHMGRGPMWSRIVTTEIEDCSESWWLHLLYLNNYFSPASTCMGHTWYLAVDFQCYLTSMLVLIAVIKFKDHTKLILGSAIFLWILVPFLQTYVEQLNPLVTYFPETILHLEKDRTFQRTYVPFHGNASAYFVGVIFGYIYYSERFSAAKKTKCKYVLIWTIWMTVPWTFFLLSFIFFQPNYVYEVVSASIYASVYKTLFGMGIAVLVTGCALGYGWIANAILSWKPFQVLGRLTYTTYLIHFCVQRLQSGATKQPVFLDEYSLICSAFSDVVVSAGLALVLCLCVEMPSSAIPKIFLQSGKPSGNNNCTDKDVPLQGRAESTFPTLLPHDVASVRL